MVAEADDYVHYIDCGGPFLSDTGIHPALMPDGIHPWAEGLDLQMACLEPFISKLIADTNVSTRAVPRVSLRTKSLVMAFRS
jgi:hypothetical protein